MCKPIKKLALGLVKLILCLSKLAVLLINIVFYTFYDEDD